MLSQQNVLTLSIRAFLTAHRGTLNPTYQPTGTTSPPYWQKPVYLLDPLDATNNGFINEDLIVWMREAAFPNFKKLYGVLVRTQEPFTNGLPAGNYSIDIVYSIHSAVQFTRGASVRLFYSKKIEMEGRNVISK